MRPQLPVLAVLAVLAIPPSLALGQDAATTAPATGTTTAEAPPATPTTPAAPTPDAADALAPPTLAPPASTTTEPAPQAPAPGLSATPMPTDPGTPKGRRPRLGADPGAKDADGSKDDASEDDGATGAKAAARERRARRERRRAARVAAKDRADGAKDASQKDDPSGAADDRTTADVLGAPATALSKLSVARFRIPPFLLPIYQAAGMQYGIRWELLAAINEVETDYGRNLNVSSAGALGWMQFMPPTWKSYGVDANGDGEQDPYNPVDAIFAAARYLKAAGGATDPRRAVFAYNHAGWYVDDVLQRARAIASLPADVVSSLTGLTLAQLPVYVPEDDEDRAESRAAGESADDADSAGTAADKGSGKAADGGNGKGAGDARNGKDAAGTAAGKAKDTTDADKDDEPSDAAGATTDDEPSRTAADRVVVRRGGSETWAPISAPAGAPAVAVQDGTVVRTGRSRALGRYVEIRDAYGNRYTYAGLDSVATHHLVPRKAADAGHHGHDDEAGHARDAGDADEAGQADEAGHARDAGDADEAGQADKAGHDRAAADAGQSGHAGEAGDADEGAHARAAADNDETGNPRAAAGAAETQGDRDAAAADHGRDAAAGHRATRDDGAASTARSGAIATVGPARPRTVADDDGPTTARRGAAADDRGLSGPPPAPAAPAPTPTAPTTSPAPTTAAPAPGPTGDAADPTATAPGAPSDPSAAPADGATTAPAPTTATAPTPTTATAPTPATTPTAMTPAPTATTPAVPSSPDAIAPLVPVAPPTTVGGPPGGFGAALNASLGAVVRTIQPVVEAATAPEPTTPEAPEAARAPTLDRIGRYLVRAGGVRRSDVRLRRLRPGSRVMAGTVLGRVGETAMRFGIRPAGQGAPRIDPRPIVAGWRVLDDASVFGHDDRSELVADRADEPDVGRLLLLSKERLQARVLADPRLEIYAAGRADIRAGQIDRRVLATMEFLTANGLRLSISSLRSGHSILSASGNVSAHSYGAAMDIASVNGVPIVGHQGAGSITASTIRLLLRLQGTAKPNQIISLMTFPGTDNTLAMADHDDHIHVGFPRDSSSGDAKLGRQVSAILQPAQWTQLVGRLAQIDNPTVRRTPSPAARRAKGDDR